MLHVISITRNLNRSTYCLFLLLVINFYSCSISKRSTKESSKDYINLDTISSFSNSFYGFIIKDLDTKEVIYSKNAEKYFVPASNTKIFTLAAAMNVLGDSIPFIRYTESDTTVHFEGLGDPTFLNASFDQSLTKKFFSSRRNKIFYYYQNFPQERMGEGWMWDDYQYAYQPELSPFPMYGSLIKIKSGLYTWGTEPEYFQSYFKIDSLSKQSEIHRSYEDNHFTIPLKAINKAVLSNEWKPFAYSDKMIVDLLSDTFNIKVKLSNEPLPEQTNIMYSNTVDTLYKILMKDSDNMLAEQTLLMVAKMATDTMNSIIGINFISNKYLTNSPQKPRWRDGSGLSRYNLFTPQTIIWLLEEMINKTPRNRLFGLLAQGGQRGTLKNLYSRSDKPYIFAKTGTLSGSSNLSGFLETKSGKTLVFSFMNNNFVVGASAIRKEVEKVLHLYYDSY